ncbi:hypothetical protein [Oryza sativa Japonica Group]|uniref:Uncharacterized protein n=1 Tax=Oryza sativa subsp. japonica TaxID=39947 RepID=Q5JL52_ORYSJ|nr:hypothetical protein [Oryza sativa Japonica Group]
MPGSRRRRTGRGPPQEGRRPRCSRRRCPPPASLRPDLGGRREAGEPLPPHRGAAASARATAAALPRPTFGRIWEGGGRPGSRCRRTGAPPRPHAPPPPPSRGLPPAGSGRGGRGAAATAPGRRRVRMRHRRRPPAASLRPDLGGEAGEPRSRSRSRPPPASLRPDLGGEAREPPPSPHRVAAASAAASAAGGGREGRGWGAEKPDFRRRTTNFTPIYIFVGGHLTPRLMSACEKKTPTLEKKYFFSSAVFDT